jgi:hypothetical protein
MLQITYIDFAGRHHAYDLLKTLVRQLPMHLIYGAIDDYMQVLIIDIVGILNSYTNIVLPDLRKRRIV